MDVLEQIPLFIQHLRLQSWEAADHFIQQVFNGSALRQVKGYCFCIHHLTQRSIKVHLHRATSSGSVLMVVNAIIAQAKMEPLSRYNSSPGSASNQQPCKDWQVEDRYNGFTTINYFG